MLTVYKASAGSGKTYQLALHYIKMVLGVKTGGDNQWRLNPALLTDAPSQAHRRILAITFTNKATEEMKSRIIASLDALAHAADEKTHSYIPLLISEFGCSFDELRTAAAHAMVSLLLDFSFFNVSTIDSFFQTILRTFARELGIQGDYNIRIDAKDAIRDALNILLDDLNSNVETNADTRAKTKRIRQWLDQQAAGKSGKYNPFKRTSRDYEDLIKSVEKIFTEDFKPYQDQLRAYLADQANLDRFAQQLRRQADAIPEALCQAAIRVRKEISDSGQEKFVKSNTFKFIDKIFNAEVAFDKPAPVAFKRAIDGDESGEEYKLNKNAHPSPAYIAAIDSFRQSLLRIYARHHTINLLLDSIPHLEFISMMLDYLDRLRADENMLILDDTSTHIARIINGSDIPFIYEHMGNHLRHFLIDEFQDTSRLQWKNLLPLLANSLAEDDDSLIIGDVKQAIYRFRNSDASILDSGLEADPALHVSDIIVKGQSRNDNRNHRTAHGIVKFNNTILPRFAALALDSDNPRGYTGDAIRQLCSPRLATLDSHIALFPYIEKQPSEKGTPKYDQPLDIPPYDFDGNPLRQPLIVGIDNRDTAIIRQIRRQHDIDGIPWSDIAILFRNYKSVTSLVSRMLAEGIPVQSAESLYVKNSSAVRLLVSLLTMLAKAGTPARNTTAQSDSSTSARSSNRYIDHIVFESRYNYFRYNGDGDVSPREAIKRALDIDPESPDNDIQVAKSLDDAINRILRRHPATLTATVEAVLASGLIPQSVIDDEKDFVAAFSDLALDYSETTDNDLNGFLNWWEQHRDVATIIPPPQCDAVRVMSLHKAKGLEFNCVHLVDFSWKLVDERESAWLDIRPGNPDDIDLDLDFTLGLDAIPPLMVFEITKRNIGYAGSPFARYLDARQKLMRVDALNIAYVALTRPISRLNIYYDPIVPNTVGSVLATVLDSLVGTSPECDYTLHIPDSAYNPDTKALQLHVPAPAPGPEPQTDTDQPADTDETPEQLALQYSAKYRSYVRRDMLALVCVNSLNPDSDETIDDDDDDLLVFDDAIADTHAVTASMRPAVSVPGDPDHIFRRRSNIKMENTQRGLDIHEILAHIPYFNPDSDDFETTFSRAVEQSMRAEGFNPDAIDQYRQTVRDIVTSNEYAHWFSPRNHIDTEISYHCPWKPGDKNDPYQLGHTRRIDRLVELPDGSIQIVDYKFTRVQDIRYIDQMQQYIRAMRRIFPGRPVTGYLLYHDLRRVVPVNLPD